MSTKNISIIIISLVVLVSGGLIFASVNNNSNNDSNTENTSNVSKKDMDSTKTNVSLEVKDLDESNPANETSMPADDSEPIVSDNGPQFANGTYTKEVEYNVPRGFKEDIIVELSLENDIVQSIDVSFTTPTNDESASRQATFSSGFDSEEFVGENLEEVVQTRVSGASLSSQAFNDAIREITSDAS